LSTSTAGWRQDSGALEAAERVGGDSELFSDGRDPHRTSSLGSPRGGGRLRRRTGAV